MARKMKPGKFSHAAHVKPTTHGTSNEISFSVLDSARIAMEKEQGAAEGTPLGSIKLFTLNGKRKKRGGLPVTPPTFGLPQSDAGGSDVGIPVSSGTVASSASSESQGVAGETKASTPLVPLVEAAPSSKSSSAAASLGPEYEIARRKTRRRVRTAAAVAVVVVLAAGLLGAGGMYLQSQYLLQKENVSVFDQALDQIARADETIVAMDAILADPFSEKSQKDIESVQEKLASTQTLLNSANAISEDSVQNMAEGLDKEAAANALLAVTARRQMLESGSTILGTAKQAASAVAAVKASWASILEADSLARNAAQKVDGTTKKNLQESQAATTSALEKLGEARSSIDNALSTYPSLGDALDALIKYIDARSAALNHAVAADEALLNEKTKRAKKENDAYNEADAKAAKLAASLPKDPTAPVLKTYQKDVTMPAKTYEQARSQGALADAFIRDYQRQQEN